MNIQIIDKEKDECIVAVCPNCNSKNFKHIHLDLQEEDYLTCKHCGMFYNIKELLSNSTY